MSYIVLFLFLFFFFGVSYINILYSHELLFLFRFFFFYEPEILLREKTNYIGKQASLTLNNKNKRRGVVTKIKRTKKITS